LVYAFTGWGPNGTGGPNLILTISPDFRQVSPEETCWKGKTIVEKNTTTLLPPYGQVIGLCFWDMDNVGKPNDLLIITEYSGTITILNQYWGHIYCHVLHNASIQNDTIQYRYDEQHDCKDLGQFEFLWLYPDFPT